MKPNEAPEKIYLTSDEKKSFVFTQKRSDNKGIEYARADAFIEKACNYLNENCRRFILTEKDINDFRNYMGE